MTYNGWYAVKLNQNKSYTLVQKDKATTKRRRNLDWSIFFFQKFIF